MLPVDSRGCSAYIQPLMSKLGVSAQLIPVNVYKSACGWIQRTHWMSIKGPFNFTLISPLRYPIQTLLGKRGAISVSSRFFVRPLQQSHVQHLGVKSAQQYQFSIVTKWKWASVVRQPPHRSSTSGTLKGRWIYSKFYSQCKEFGLIRNCLKSSRELNII